MPEIAETKKISFKEIATKPIEEVIEEINAANLSPEQEAEMEQITNYFIHSRGICLLVRTNYADLKKNNGGLRINYAAYLQTLGILEGFSNQ